MKKLICAICLAVIMAGCVLPQKYYPYHVQANRACPVDGKRLWIKGTNDCNRVIVSCVKGHTFVADR